MKLRIVEILDDGRLVLSKPPTSSRLKRGDTVELRSPKQIINDELRGLWWELMEYLAENWRGIPGRYRSWFDDEQSLAERKEKMHTIIRYWVGFTKEIINRPA